MANSPAPDLRGDTLLIHEVVFTAFLVVNWALLVRAQGLFGPDAAIFAIVLLTTIGLVVRHRHFSGPAAWRRRVLVFAVGTAVTFSRVGDVIGAVNPAWQDAALRRIDHTLFAMDPVLFVAAFGHPVLTEMFSLSYLWLFVYLVVAGLHYLRTTDLGEMGAYFSGLFTVYGIGQFLYVAVPALGPERSMPEAFTVPLTGWLLTAVTQAIMRIADSPGSVFPSLHLAVTLYMLAFDHQHHRSRFYWFLLPCLLLWCSTVYLRYHYVIDLLAGVPLATLGFIVAQWDFRRLRRSCSPALPRGLPTMLSQKREDPACSPP